MVRVEDIPESLPEMDELDDTKKKVVEEFLETIRETYKGELPYIFQREESLEQQRRLAYKFLKARKWKPKNALAMVTSTVEFRAENHLDDWKLFPCAFPLLGYDEEEIRKVVDTIPGPKKYPRDDSELWDGCYRALQASYANLYHYYDKEGHPVLYDCCGQANVKEILADLAQVVPVGKDLKDVIVPYHTYMNEVQYYLIRYANARSLAAGKRPIMGITVVLDLEGLHFGMLQRRFISVLQKIFELDQKYYPELLHRLFVINCPSYIQMVFNLVKGSLDENTRKKMIFCSKSESLDVLRKVISDDMIPQELGGGCRCEGGCLPRYVKPHCATRKSGEDAEARGAIVEVPTEDIHVRAGKTHSRRFEVQPGDAVNWEFAVGHNTDVRFSATFTPDLSVPPPTERVRDAHAHTIVGAGSQCSPLSSSGDYHDCASVDLTTEETPESGHIAHVQSTDTASPSGGTSTAPPPPPVAVAVLAHTPAAKREGEEADSTDAATTKKSGSGKKKKKDQKGTAAEEAEVVDIKEEKLCMDVDCFVAPRKGTVELIWDNGHSWMHGKSIQMRLSQTVASRSQ